MSVRSSAQPVTLPLSELQEELWRHQRRHPASSAENLALAATIVLPFEETALATALDEVLGRHSIFRARITEEEGRPVARLVAPVSGQLVREELAPDADLLEAIRSAAFAPFQLETSGPVRARLLVKGAQQVLVLAAHHLAMDLPSMAIVLLELESLLTGEALSPPRTAPPPRGTPGSRDFWLKLFRSLPRQVPALRMDPRALPGAQPGGCAVEIDDAQVRKLQQLARSHRTTLFTVLLATVQLLHHRWTGQKDVVTSVPVSRRDRSSSRAVGCFVHPIAVRTRPAPEARFAGLLAEVHRGLRLGVLHGDVPVPQVCSVRFGYLETPQRTDLAGWTLGKRETPVKLGPLLLEPIDLSPAELGVALQWDCARVPEGLRIRLCFDSAQVTPAMAGWLCAEYRELLGRVAQGEDVPLVPEPVHERIRAQGQRTPDAVAVRRGTDQWTYQQLLERAATVGSSLREEGPGRRRLVALEMSQSFERIATVLGSFEAGCAFLALDPSDPPARKAQLASDSGADQPVTGGGDEGLAYVLYTSGSTGQPKAVEITHANLAAFLQAMDPLLGKDQPVRWLSVTRPTFDISYLEMLWPLTRGGEVVLLDEGPAAPVPASLEFSLSFFGVAPADGIRTQAGYRELLSLARFADERGFAALWIPERHFHPFGGMSPNPAVLAAALAAQTRRIALRAGSVVLPLHDPVRVCEDWRMVDELSGGRVGLSVAPGWRAEDFALNPQAFAERRRIVPEALRTLRALWRGEPIRREDGLRRSTEVEVFPRGTGGELPLWLTTAARDETWQQAADQRAGVLTHLLGQSLDDLRRRIGLYRDACRRGGWSGQVTLLVHTFLASSDEEARVQAKRPLCDYLRSASALVGLSDDAGDARVEAAAEAVLTASAALIGSEATCLERARALAALGINEVACLVDFGIDPAAVRESLERLDRVRVALEPPRTRRGMADQVIDGRITHLQLTPSRAAGLLSEPRAAKAIGGLSHLIVGGESCPPELARALLRHPPRNLWNAYGPTEATIWSTFHRVEGPLGDRVPIGAPFPCVQLDLVSESLDPVPGTEVGEIVLGGPCVARGYRNRPEESTRAFVDHPILGRIYRTGDLGRTTPRGIEFVGRRDDQLKVRGTRLEPGEVEAHLVRHPSVASCAVVVRSQSLVAYYVPRAGGARSEELRSFLARSLPAAVLPSAFHPLPELPLTPHGKVDRQRLATAAPLPDALVQALARFLQARLGGVPIRGSDSFFDVGGHSLLAMELIAKVQGAFQVELAPQVLLERPTMEGIAAAIIAGARDPRLIEDNLHRFEAPESPE